MKKETKRTREGTIKQVRSLNRVIWKLDSLDIKQGDLDTTTFTGDFAGANFDLVSQLNKEFLDKEQELQKAKKDLAQTKEQHKQEIQLLKEEYEDKLK